MVREVAIRTPVDLGQTEICKLELAILRTSWSGGGDGDGDGGGGDSSMVVEKRRADLVDEKVSRLNILLSLCVLGTLVWKGKEAREKEMDRIVVTL